ncbi:MAG: monofunctional biosynthetic peptidoglycan transglycosylase [Alphaproteobacteria bacterium]
MRRFVLGALLIVLAGPPLLILLYRFVPPPATPLMVMRLFEGEGLAREWVSMSRIAPDLRAAVIAAEDNLFCVHGGFDWDSLRQAYADYRRGAGLRGASTISMQTAKNVLLWPGRTLVRKGLEAWFTTLIEALWDKPRILEVYLNVAEWAPGVYGAEAAARHHFGKAAADLSRREAALLAAVLPNPRRWSASRPTQYITRRAATIQRRIGQLGPLLDCARSV